MDRHGALFGPGVEELFYEPERFEDLERAGMHHSRAVPVHWRRAVIDQLAWHTAPMKLRGEQQSGRTRTDHQHRPVGAGVARITLRRHLF